MKLHITASILILYLIFGMHTKTVAQINNRLSGANEKVYLHLAKNYYIAGEILPYTAYLFSSETGKYLPKSKIVYYTLRNTKNLSTISWWNRISHEQLPSAMQLPDTLSSGIYELYAYTNAMRNISAGFIFKTCLYISQINEEEPDFYNLPVDSFSLDIQVNTDGDKLIAGLKNSIAWFIPPLFGKADSLTVFLMENGTDTMNVYTGKFENTGILNLTPEQSKRYSAILKFQTKEYRIDLPEVQEYGYTVHAKFDSSQNLEVMIYANESKAMRQNPIQLLFYSQHNRLISKNVTFRNDSATLFFKASEIPSGLMNLQLQADSKALYNKLLVNPKYIEASQNTIECKLSKKEIYPRDSIHILCSLKGFTATDTAFLSVAVCQKISRNTLPVQNIMQYAVLRSEMSCNLANFVNSDAINNLLTAMPYKNYKWRNLCEETAKNCYFPAEQNGYLLTGRVWKKYNFTLPQNNIVLLAIHDSLSYLDYSAINSTGDFAFLLDAKYGNRKIMLSLYKNDTSELVWQTDEKNLLLPKVISRRIAAPVQMKQFIEEYKKRYLITNVYTPQKPEALFNYSYTPKTKATKFVFNPEFVIQLDNYVYLNSFEEIAGNIVPGVKFVEKRNEYKIRVINQQTQEYHKHAPLVLLNGVPCTNYAYINSLNSETIESVAINRQCIFYGDATFYGIISVRTREKLFGNHVLDGYFMISHHKNQIAGEKASVAITADNVKNMKSPLLSPLLYWKPNILLSGNNTLDLQFFVSDLPGEYDIQIQGIVNENPVYLKKSFTIKQNPKLCDQ